MRSRILLNAVASSVPLLQAPPTLNDAVDAAFLTEPSFTRAMMSKLAQPVAQPVKFIAGGAQLAKQ